MTTTTFITGDRMMTALYPGQVVIEMMRAMNEGRRIATGVNEGVEQIVRDLAAATGVEIDVIDQIPQVYPQDPRDFIDWDARHRALSDDTEVVCVHVDPHTCRVTKSALRVLPDERVRLLTVVDLIV